MIYGPCDKCGKKKFFVKQRKFDVSSLRLPIPNILHVKESLCTTCFKKLADKVYSMKADV